MASNNFHFHFKSSNISAMPLVGTTKPGPAQSLIPMVIDGKLYYLSSGVRKSTTERNITYKNSAKVESSNISAMPLEGATKPGPAQSLHLIPMLIDDKLYYLSSGVRKSTTEISITYKNSAKVVTRSINLSASTKTGNGNPNQNKQKIIQQSSEKVITEKASDVVVKIEPPDSDDANDLPEEGRSLANESPNQNKQKTIQQSSEKVINEKACDIVVKIEPPDSDDANGLPEENKSTHEESGSFENINLKTEVFYFQGAEIKKETPEENVSNCTTEADENHTNEVKEEEVEAEEIMEKETKTEEESTDGESEEDIDYECPCGKLFYDLAKYEKHMAVCKDSDFELSDSGSKSKNPGFGCRGCSKIYDNSADLKKHKLGCDYIIEHFDDDTEQNEASSKKRKVQMEMPTVELQQYTSDSIKGKLKIICEKKLFLYKRKDMY